MTTTAVVAVTTGEVVLPSKSRYLLEASKDSIDLSHEVVPEPAGPIPDRI